MKEILLSINDVTKKYCKSRYHAMLYGFQDIFYSMLSADRSPYLRDKEFIALRDISFDVNRGDCVGILGSNGAGKTTLLKIILGVLKPTRGVVARKGSIASLLSLSSGIHMDLTCKENIFYYFALHGKTKNDANKNIDCIIQTAELGEYINMPLKMFSSGMLGRLLFSMTIYLRPDILILDDIFYVGDYTFREKCQNLLTDIKRNSTILFASHTPDLLMSLSDKILILEKGERKYFGEKEDVISHYHEHFEKPKKYSESMLEQQLDVYDFTVQSEREKIPYVCSYGDKVKITFKMKAKHNLLHYRIILVVKERMNRPIVRAEMTDQFGPFKIGQEKTVSIDLGCVHFVVGTYAVSFKIYNWKTSELIDLIENATTFSVVDGPLGIWPAVQMEYTWKEVAL